MTVLPGRGAVDDVDVGVGRHELDLTSPVELDGRRADHQVRAVGGCLTDGDDRLARLPEPHVVGQDGTAAGEQKGDAGALVSIEARIGSVDLARGLDKRVVRRWRVSTLPRTLSEACDDSPSGGTTALRGQDGASPCCVGKRPMYRPARRRLFETGNGAGHEHDARMRIDPTDGFAGALPARTRRYRRR